MSNPVGLRYSKTHEWVKNESDTVVTVGITDYAQHALGDIVFINLPEVGDAVEKGTPFSDVESVKAVVDVNCPVSGIVAAVNEELLDAPETMNTDPYGAWIVKVEAVTEEEELMDAKEYEAFCEQEV